MDNLTLILGFVKQNVAAAPIPGHKVVVFKEYRGARKVYKVLDDDAEPIKPPIFSNHTYVSVAVNSHPNLSFDQSTEVSLKNQYKHFTLGCKVYFQIVNAEPLAIWFKDDPIRVIWEEIKTQFSSSVKKSGVTIEDVMNHFNEVEKVILSDDALMSIRDRAIGYGIDIKKILLHHQVPDDETAVAIAVAKHGDEIKIEMLNEEMERNKRTREMHAKEHELEMKRRESVTKALSETYEQLPVAVKQMVEHITGPDSFRGSLDALMESAKKYFTNPRESIYNNNIYLVDDKKKALAVGKTEPFEELQLLLSDIINEIEDINSDKNDKDEVLAAAHHLNSELLRGKNADSNVIYEYLEKLEEYRKKYKDIISIKFMGNTKEFKAKLQTIVRKEISEKDIEIQRSSTNKMGE